MNHSFSAHVGYVVKVYPRYSETFIVNEILAHEAAGWMIDIFSLRPSQDTHFQDRISRVRAAVTHIPAATPKIQLFWEAVHRLAASYPAIWNVLRRSTQVEPLTIYQALLLAEHVQRKSIRHLHAHFATVPASVARLAAAITGISYSFTAHAKDIYHESVDTHELQQKIDEAAAVVTVSEFNIEHLEREYDVPHGRLHRVYNGLDLDHFTFESPEQRPSRILAVGRLVEKKGFDVLVDACHLLRQRGTEFRCDIVGTGDREAVLQTAIAKRQLAEVVQLRGPLPQREVMQALRESSVLAVPCVVGDDGNRDGLPTVILEAMALGTPVVSTDVTGIPEVVRHQETGLLVPQRDPAALADALASLLRDAPQRVRLAAEARHRMEADFAATATAAQLRKYFRQCLLTQPGSPTPDIPQVAAAWQEVT